MLKQHQTPFLTILVSAGTLEGARRSIHGCETCSDNAAIPFSDVLGRLTGYFNDREYLIEEEVQCPSCDSAIESETLVELHRANKAAFTSAASFA